MTYSGWRDWEKYLPDWTKSIFHFQNQADIQSHIVTVKGVELSDPPEQIRYYQLGHGKTILFFAPGNNTSAVSYLLLLQEFAAVPDILAEYTVILPDYRGSGQSSYHKKIKDLRDFAHDFDQVLGHIIAKRNDSHTENITPKIHLVGYSMGFAVAMEMLIINPARYHNLVGLAPVGTRGYRLHFNSQQAGFDGKTHWQAGDYIPNHDDKIGIAATAFHQRAWQGMQRTPIAVKFIWDMTVFNDIGAYNLTGLTPTNFGFSFSPTYASIIQEEFNIKFMPESLYFLHKFNISNDAGGEHVNSNGLKVTRAGDGRLGQHAKGKKILLLKAATDYRNWRGDVVLPDHVITTSLADLTDSGAEVQAVLIDANQGYDHGFPLTKPVETVAILHRFLSGKLTTAEDASQALAGARVQLLVGSD